MIERNQLWLDVQALSINKSRCRYSKTIIYQSVNESGGYLPRRVATQWISSTIHLHHGEQLLNIIASLHEIHNFDRTAKPNITKKTQGNVDVDILKRLFTKVSMKVVDIYLAALQHSEYPPLFTSTTVNNCWTSLHLYMKFIILTGLLNPTSPRKRKARFPHSPILHWA